MTFNEIFALRPQTAVNDNVKIISDTSPNMIFKDPIYLRISHQSVHITKSIYIRIMHIKTLTRRLSGDVKHVNMAVVFVFFGSSSYVAKTRAGLPRPSSMFKTGMLIVLPLSGMLSNLATFSMPTMLFFPHEDMTRLSV